MSKSSIICNSCGQDTDSTATFCSECGASITTSESDKSTDLETPERPSDKSSQSETSASQPEYPWQMMMREMKPMFQMMRPMFLMMMIMMVIMAGIFIYIIFFSDIELPFGN